MLALLWASSLACQSPPGVDPIEWDTLLRLPGVRVTAFDMAPDGALFIATPEAIHRALPQRPDSWSVVTNTDRFTVELEAISQDQVFALVRFGDVYRWTAQANWSPVGVIPDSLLLVDGGTRRAFVRDWWIPNSREIYMAGEAGLVLHYDGAAWNRVPSDGLPPLDWTQIDGDSSTIVLAGTEIWQREGVTWQRLPGSATEALQCGPLALVVRPSDLIIAGHWIALAPCLRRYESGTWRSVGNDLRDFSDRPFGGALQTDGSALIWSTSADLARVAGAAVTLYRLPDISDFSGAALHGGYLYFAGTLHGDGIVGRIRQP